MLRRQRDFPRTAACLRSLRLLDQAQAKASVGAKQEGLYKEHRPRRRLCALSGSEQSKWTIQSEEMAISEAMTATPRVKSIQRTALAMLVVAGVINYVDRATLSVANLLIRDDLHLSIADMGYL